jgi:polygalacturonase
VSDGGSVETTERLQRAIDAGGHVVVPPGVHVVRTLHLRSGVTLAREMIVLDDVVRA